MPISNWATAEDWDSVYLAGRRLPGVGSLHVRLPGGLDVKKPKGSKKARVRDVGVPPAELTITQRMSYAQLAEFQQNIIPLIRPRSKDGERQKVLIAHPQAQLWGVNEVLVGDIDAPNPAPGGTFDLTLTAFEYRDPQKTKKRELPKSAGDEDGEGWDVNKLIDELPPSKTGAAADNFL